MYKTFFKKVSKLIYDVIEASKPQYHIKDDWLLCSELCNIICKVLGDERYKKLVELSQITPTIFSDYASGLPYIAIVFPYLSDNEKTQAEKLLQVVLEKYLIIHNLNHNILIDWKEHSTLNLPVIMLRYSETKEESAILVRTIQLECKKLVQHFTSVIDEDIENEEDI